jgi:RNA polymerase sigma-70 factor, ECF subfamily
LWRKDQEVSVAVPRESPQASPWDTTFRDIFESEYAYVRLSVRRLGIREPDLDDAVHDVFVVVHRKLAEFDTKRPLRPWLFGIAFRVALGEKRRFRNAREELATGEEIDYPDKRPHADEELETEERRRMVHAALGGLDDAKRAVFIMHELDETPMPEIADVLGIPTNTAYSRLRLAREDFRQGLERQLLRGKSGKGLAT